MRSSRKTWRVIIPLSAAPRLAWLVPGCDTSRTTGYAPVEQRVIDKLNSANRAARDVGKEQKTGAPRANR